MKSCSIIGHRDVETTDDLKTSIMQTARHLIINDGITDFLFGSRSVFKDLCYDVITELKKEFDYIRRIYVRSEYPNITEHYYNYLKRFYEDSYFYSDTQNGRLNYIKRNEKMIDESEICLFYYNVEYKVASKTKSGTHLAYKYAQRKNKKIINLYKK